MYKTGLGSYVKSNSNSTTPQNLNNKEGVPVRVKDIILDENHPKFNLYGEWNSIGVIEYELIDTINPTPNFNLYAFPYSSNQKFFPLINEIVILYNLPNKDISEIDSSTISYYISPLSIWNSIHHNAYPLFQQENIANNYKKIERGNNTTKKNLYFLNSPYSPTSFVEKNNIKPLLPFPGDIIYEGRFGNSIRLGSTCLNNSSIKNNWSTIGDLGDPIIIIRNGQNPNEVFDFKPTIENINTDKSSIYLTSTQKIPLTLQNEVYSALRNTPKSISEYNGPQLIFNSDRIIISSKNDNLILNSLKDISLNSDNIGLTSKKELAISSPKIFLGDINANEPIILGNRFMSKFKDLLQNINNLCSILEQSQIWPGGSPSPNVPLKQVAKLLKSNTELLLNDINDPKQPLLSKVSKTV